ncbi:Ribose ABC transport system ATP-binding protein RbsA [Bacillus subtilis]|uniref:D-ribose pyranase n=1 Tax=Bacillus subtilis TaxID=1423 RepID=A0AAP1H5W0_BACIU|nr:Ribose ABC transport system ATP-binding protein RbsA [Bacillus subtilis]
MKKHGILNSHLAKILADLGHTDKIVIADAGLPVPDGVLKIDLSLKPGLPAFQDTAAVLAEEMAVEKVIAAAEIKASNQENAKFLENLFSEQEIEYLSHEEFKLLTKGSHKNRRIHTICQLHPAGGCAFFKKGGGNMQIEMKDIHKTFGKNQVLSGVSFQLMPGEVHALMGENGAGKSTLMNILTGLHKADKGQISINGNETYFSNPKEAEQHGIAFIHQELNIWPEMTVLENLFIGKEISSKLGVLQTRKMKALAKEQFDKLSVSLSLDQEAGECSVGQQQMIEIAKALMTNAEVIIMDEPTAALTEREISKLFESHYSVKKERRLHCLYFASHGRNFCDLRQNYHHA